MRLKFRAYGTQGLFDTGPIFETTCCSPPGAKRDMPLLSSLAAASLDASIYYCPVSEHGADTFRTFSSLRVIISLLAAAASLQVQFKHVEWGCL